jgi:hypothetical protein
MADASFFGYQTGVPMKIVPQGDGTYAYAVELMAGSITIGKVAIDQTIPGATNGVVVNSLPQLTAQVAETPTVTAGTYAANKVIGGIMTFSNVLPATSPYGGVLESITVKFKASVQTVAFNVAVFTASPSGTFTDGQTAAIATTDSALLLGIYQLSLNNSSLGTHTIYNLDGIAKAIDGSSANLYIVVVPTATTAALASTSDMIVSLGILQG